MSTKVVFAIRWSDRLKAFSVVGKVKTGKTSLSNEIKLAEATVELIEGLEKIFKKEKNDKDGDK